MSPIRILLADDHPSLRAGLAAILNADPRLTVVAEAGSGSETIAAVAAHKPDVTILDMRMPDGDGISTLRKLTASNPSIRALILTTYDNEEDVFNALDAGARGYLLKDTTREELINAVVQVHAGERYLPPAIAARLANRAVRPTLSAREMDALRLICKGRSNKEMAVAMFVSEETVKTHVKSLFTKLDVHDRAQAVTTAIQRGPIKV